MKEFSSRTMILMEDAGIALKSLGSRRLLLVSDPYFEKNGLAKTLLTACGASETALFSQVTPDPSLELAAQGTALVKEFAPDTVVALGGGSAMDCAKAMVYFSGMVIRLVAIPTTSGSGSEVTDFAILTHESTKHPLVDRRLCPEIAILDEKLLAQLPPGLIADGGFDVLSHALESYVATNANPFTDALAKDAFCTALTHLYPSFRGNTALRQPMHCASTMAGMAFTQAGLGLCHAISHSLGGLFHLPHGRLNAILLPAVVLCNAQTAGEKYARLARAAGLGSAADTLAVRNLVNELTRLRRQLNLPDTLAGAGIPPQQVRRQQEQIIAAAMADPCSCTNPRKAEPALIRAILEEVTGRG